MAVWSADESLSVSSFLNILSLTYNVVGGGGQLNSDIKLPMCSLIPVVKFSLIIFLVVPA